MVSNSSSEIGSPTTVKQFNNSAKLDSETTKEFYENIDKYIEQKLSEKDLQNDRAKENEADKDWG